MIYLIIYLLVGLGLASITYLEDDRRAIKDPMAAFLFAIAWPIIIYYLVGLLMKRGVIKYKGRVIWKATK